jgi:exo-beta-1,3-glucanase (GH17 family)/cellulose synthase/poly-beta-1,6-N-acetylglucosamine synthase-like glycosyltransferase
MRKVFAALAVVACAHGAFWAFTRGSVDAPATPPRLSSLSFAPYEPSADAEAGEHTTRERIGKDLKAVAPLARSIRTYAVTGGLEHIPEMAAEHGLKVTLGAWLDKDDERNEREIKAAVDLARKNPNVSSLVVGNEVVLRRDKTVPEMIEFLRRVKAESPVPITTGEVWHVWLANPELAAAVDFLAVHILPYWEGMDAKDVVNHTFIIYEKLRRAFPGKHIVIAEFGWPSAGHNMKAAQPGDFEQAQIIREFVSRAAVRGVDYNLVEAFDQPWKHFEGSVGPYWGIMNSDREPKFALNGPITDTAWQTKAGVALLLGFLLSIPIFTLRQPTFRQAASLAVAANAVGAWGALLIDFWLNHYFVLGAQIAMVAGTLFLIPLAIIILARFEEMANITFGAAPARLLRRRQNVTLTRAPKVSIHIPAYREPPEMLKKTLDSVAALAYPNLECVVVINNTPDPELWQPIEEHCRLLGDRFKFLNIEKLEGFKAGALRVALEHTAPDAEIIGIIDADYVVAPNWLADVVPAFEDPQVGIVQAPQDHRDAARTHLHGWMNTEYAGFFDIGMVERNEIGAIVVHGTMCLIRRAAMMDAGGWSSDTICEDTDLGLAIMERGWTAHYTRERYGWGLLPDNYDAFRKQRHRWAFGGVQIAVKHLRRFFDGSTRLTPEQRRTYLVGWLSWMGSETVGVGIAIMNLLWVPVVAFGGIAIPEMVLTIPVLVGFAVYLLHFIGLYAQRVRHAPGVTAGAAIAAMSVQLTVARAVFEGLVKQHMPFIRTAKGGASSRGRQFPAFWEGILSALLIGGAVLLHVTNTDEVSEINLFAVVLVVQSLPLMAAVVIASLERSRLNDPEVLRGWRTRLAALVPLRLRAGTPAVQAQMDSANSR